MALSYLTPALTRRMQKQLLAQLAPSEVRKLHRTLSSRNSSDNNPYEPPRNASSVLNRRSVDRLSSTLPRKYSNDNSILKTTSDLDEKHLVDSGRSKELDVDKTKSSLPVKSHLKSDIKSSHRDNQINDEVTIRGLRATRSTTSREARPYFRTKTDSNVIHSPDSSLSESLSSCARDADSEFSSRGLSTDSYSSLYRPSLSKTDDIALRYSRPNKSNDSSPSSLTNSSKTDVKKLSSTKRISRFLRPDFFDSPKDENIVVKEKKEREIETQKVLKEIRDKRKERLCLKRGSPAKEKSIDTDYSNCDHSQSTTSSLKETESSSTHFPDYEKTRNAVKFEEKTPEKNTKLPDYVNFPSNTADIAKKSRISKIARPKSYPAESSTKPVSRIPEKTKISPEKESKLSKFRKGFVKKESKEKSKEDKNETNKNINEEEKVHKNKLLQSIEKKLEKFRSSPDKIKENSAVENTIRKLREQSLPKNLEHCTESGLIKRAVSVEDISNAQLHDKPLQASRKSVTKILGLFKKYEESENKKNEKLVKKKKIKTKTETKSKVSETDGNKKNKEDKLASEIIKPTVPEKADEAEARSVDEIKVTNCSKEVKPRQSKLPVTSFRRSLNLENVSQDSVKVGIESEVGREKKDNGKLDKESLRLDFSKIRGSKTEPGISEHLPSTSYEYSRGLDPKRNSFGTTHSSQYLSPSDDMSCDSWSICSEAHSPLSPNGQIYSGDESESVIDRIRRKSFYTRFNEKKKPHTKSYMKSYRDLDLYKDIGLRAPNNYGSLDRKAYNYDKFDRITNHTPDSQKKKEYRPYNRSASVLNDYVNLVGQYQPYNSKSNYTSSLYSDSESTLDEDNSAAKLRNSSLLKPSSLNRMTSKSPSSERIHIETPTTSVVPPTNFTRLH